MILFATVLEPTPDAAIRAIHDLTADHDGVEVRVEPYEAYDPAAFRAATSKQILLTRRGGFMTEDEMDAAIGAGIDWIDVEHGRSLPSRHRNRIVLSHHDYEAMPDVASILGEMRLAGCAHTKVAVTPYTLDENLRLLEEIRPGVTVIGMGERGLYSRILAPFLGSELVFAGDAAPGQISLQQALDIYGEQRTTLHADRVFAVAGNPAGHSQSPRIHNRLFREKDLPAAYTIASVERFDEAARALRDGHLSGLSVTAPFKEDALRFAEQAGFEIGENAAEARAVNTLIPGYADNTDVDGFETILRFICGRDRKSAAVLGAGGTARAALVALRRLGVTAQVFQRATLPDVASFGGEIIINALPPDVEVSLPLRPGMSYVEAGYGGARRDWPGIDYHDGIELLEAQAVRQHDLFMRVFA